MIKGYIRGNRIYFDGNDYRFVDDDSICNDDHPCVRCGRKPTKEGYDACTRKIQGVDYACCGHGIKKPYAAWRTYLGWRVRVEFKKGGKT